MAVLLLGLLSIGLLFWIHHVDEEQQSRLGRVEAIMDMQFKMSLAHLWLEEVVAGEKSIDPSQVWENLDTAIMLGRVLAEGGTTERGIVLGAMVQPNLLSQLQSIGLLLSNFRGLAQERLQEPGKAGIGTELDHRFNAVFREIIARSALIEETIVRDFSDRKVQIGRLFGVVVAMWLLILSVAILGLWRREARIHKVETALRHARDELELRVQERTEELKLANEQLQQEVGERVRAEESLRIYGEVVQNMPFGLYVLQTDSLEEPPTFRVIATNPTAVATTGKLPEEILGTPMLESFPWVSDTVLPGIYAEVVRSEKSKDLREFCFSSESAPGGFFSVKIFPLPHGCVGVLFENITERKMAEDAVRESEHKFRKLTLEFHALLDAISDPIVLLSPDMQIIWANKGAALMVGVDVEELKGKTCYQIRHGLSEPCEYCPTIKTFASGKSESVEVMVSEGTCWNVRAYPIRNDAGDVVNVIEMIADVSERIAFQAEAMRTAHLTSLGKLAAGVAHEVNNPINCVINYAQILFNRSGEGTEQRELSGRIISEGLRISGIVNGLLSFARERKEEKVSAHVGEVLKDCLTLSESLILKQGIRLSVDVPSDLPEITANPQQLQQVFLNLISNARYALNGKYPDFHEDKILEIRGRKGMLDGHPFVFLSFRDHGCGIPHEILDKIMVPFFSTKPAGKGTGLGLSVSHGIVEDHGGKLMVESVENQWTEAVVALPAKE